jgi:hypothetical protein
MGRRIPGWQTMTPAQRQSALKAYAAIPGNKRPGAGQVVGGYNPATGDSYYPSGRRMVQHGPGGDMDAYAWNGRQAEEIASGRQAKLEADYLANNRGTLVGKSPLPNTAPTRTIQTPYGPISVKTAGDADTVMFPTMAKEKPYAGIDMNPADPNPLAKLWLQPPKHPSTTPLAAPTPTPKATPTPTPAPFMDRLRAVVKDFRDIPSLFNSGGDPRP